MKPHRRSLRTTARTKVQLQQDLALVNKLLRRTSKAAWRYYNESLRQKVTIRNLEKFIRGGYVGVLPDSMQPGSKR